MREREGGMRWEGRDEMREGGRGGEGGFACLDREEEQGNGVEYELEAQPVDAKKKNKTREAGECHCIQGGQERQEGKGTVQHGREEGRRGDGDASGRCTHTNV